MKNIRLKRLICLTVISLHFIGCTTPYQTRGKEDYKPADMDSVNKILLIGYVELITKDIDNCIANNDPALDFWDKMVLVPLESCLNYDSSWMSFINQKGKDYSRVLVPDCTKEILSGFAQINIIPKETNYNVLRAEFILSCMGNPKREQVRAQVFKKLTNKIEGFFTPIYSKIEHESRQVSNTLDSLIKGPGETQFHITYNKLFDHAIREKVKLEIRRELDKKYTPIIESEINKFMNNMTPEQRQKYSIISKGNDHVSAFLKSLTPHQYSLLERIFYKTAFIQGERKVFKERLENLKKLGNWLEENRTLAQSSKRQEENRATLAPIIGGILIAIVAGTLAYAAWRNTYYNNYQTITTVHVNTMTKQFHAYDTKGRMFYGTIFP